MTSSLSSPPWSDLFFFPDHIPHDTQACVDTNCAMLPLGYLLLTSDIVFDLQYVLMPSGHSARRLMTYYQTLLRPSMISPGYFFPMYATYQLCVRCYSHYNLILLLLWIPIAMRYTKIYKVNLDNQQQQEEEEGDCHDYYSKHGMILKHWWTVIMLRLALYYVTYIDHKGCGCTMDTWWTKSVKGFVGWG